MFSKIIFITILSINFVYANSLSDRVSKARSYCFDQNINYYNKASFNPPHSSDFDLYRPSTTQKLLTPVYVGIFDRFGGVLQTMISGGDTYGVNYNLSALGTAARRYAYSKRLNKLGKTCLASCITNHLLEADADIFPTTSMPLAISKGRGFCRHFALTTFEILKIMGENVQTEVSFIHMFLKLNYGGEKLYFDPSAETGAYRCNFIKAKDIK
jgi:hypothetical protein